jgi:hypothetical protein
MEVRGLPGQKVKTLSEELNNPKTLEECGSSGREHKCEALINPWYCQHTEKERVRGREKKQGGDREGGRGEEGRDRHREQIYEDWAANFCCTYINGTQNTKCSSLKMGTFPFGKKKE